MKDVADPHPVLHAISTRYALHLPYTYSGIVLVSLPVHDLTLG